MQLIHVFCYLRKNTFTVLLCNLQKDGAEAEQAKKELPFTFKGKWNVNYFTILLSWNFSNDLASVSKHSNKFDFTCLKHD